MAPEIVLHVFESCRSEKYVLPKAQQDGSAIVMSDRESDVVTADSAGCGDKHDERHRQVLLRTKKAGHQQDSFTRDRQSGILKHHAKENGPVTVDQHVVLDKLE